MSENEEVVNTSTQENQQQSNNKSSFAQKTANAAKNVAKAVKKHGAKQTLLAPLVHILGPIFIGLIILIIITGIFMFLVTMPGMVMDKLSAAFEEAGKYLAAAFGADTTEMIDSEKIYETLDYIDEMGWDLKGDGFLTKFIESEADVASMPNDVKENYNDLAGNVMFDQGVARSKEDGSVVLAESDFIFTYIMSDNYIYTIKNQNLVMKQPGFLRWISGVINIALYKAYNAIYGPLLDLFGVTDGTIDKFGKGMLVIYREDGGNFGTLGTPVNFTSLWDDSDIEIDTASKKLIVKRRGNLFKNGFTLEYSLDGWTGRYGMPLEFLLAIHKATLKPDLAYDMVTTFNTNVNLVLHEITGDVITGYRGKEGVVSIQQVDRATNTYTDITDELSVWEKLVNWMDKQNTTPEEAESLWKLGIDIVDDCAACEKKILYVIYGDDIADVSEYDYGQFLVRVPYGSDQIQEDSNNGDFLDADFYYTLDDNASGDTGFWSWLFGTNEYDSDDKGNGVYAVGDDGLGNPAYAKNGKIDTWSEFNPPIPGEDEITCEHCPCVIDKDSVICSGCGKSAITSTEPDWEPCDCDEDEYWEIKSEKPNWKKLDDDMKQYINRYRTVVEICDNCKNKADAIAATMRRTSYDFRAYQPYIHSVTNHWYRDVYFVEPDDSSINLVDQDYDYESLMRDRWTLYEVHEDGDLKGNFKWYIVGKDGKYITSYSDDVRVDSSKKDVDTSKIATGTDNYLYYNVATVKEATEVGLAVSKKAITLKGDGTEISDETFKDLGWRQTNGKWTAYKVKSATQTTQTGYKPLSSMYETVDSYYTDITPTISSHGVAGDTATSVADKLYVNMATKYNVEQTGEGLRSETNPDIKKMFLQNKYFQYDGSENTAEIIAALRETRGANKKYGAIDDSELENTVTLDIDNNSENETYKLEDYVGTVTLEQDALNAFTMLENTHTLDADYIYRDFKELVVELGYFTKEQIQEEIPEVLEFPVPTIGSAGYPYREIDKVDNEFGTMIHSNFDIETNKKYLLQHLSNEGLGDISGSPAEPEVEPVSGVQPLAIGNNLGSQLSSVVVDNASKTVGDVEPEAADPYTGSGRVESGFETEEERYEREEREQEELEKYKEEVGETGGVVSSGLTTTTTCGNCGAVIDRNLSKCPSCNTTNSDVMTEEPVDASAIGDVPVNYKDCKKPSQVTIDEFFSKTREMCEYMNMVGYDYCVYSDPGMSDGRGTCICDIHCKEIYALVGVCYKQLDDPNHNCSCPCNHCKHDIHGNPHVLAPTFEGSKADRCNNVCCDQLVKWALQNVKVAPVSVGSIFDFLNGLVAEGEAEKLPLGTIIEEGDILYSSGHIEIVGEEKKDGVFVQYNGGHQVKVGAVEGGPKSAIGVTTAVTVGTGTTDWTLNGGGLYRLKWAESVEGGPYEGYEGNEAVVSPVTGILLEYGEVSTNDRYVTRVNLDKKYKSMYEDDVDGETAPAAGGTITTTPTTDGTTEAVTGEIIEEKVGYARILVLNEEYYTAYQEKIEASGYTLDMAPVETNERLNGDPKNGIPGIDFMSETVQAYKKYKDLYEYSGIAGYIVTIEGFCPELPDEEFEQKREDKQLTAEQLPNGDDLNMDTFKIALSNIENPGDKIQTKYEEPPAYEMSSDKATEKMEVEETMRKEAAYAMQVGDAIFIKEGTVLGRTYTDKEVIKTLRNEEFSKYMSEATISKYTSTEKTPTDEEKKEEKVIGNYIRVIMENGTDEEGKKTYIEDVEDYMKLDDVKKLKPNDWELFFWLPFESGGADLDGCGPESQGSCSTGETAVGIIQWTVLTSKGMNNIATQFIPGCLEKDPTLCSPLSAYAGKGPEWFWEDWNSGRREFQDVLSGICANKADREAFLAVQMEVAKEQYLEPLLNKYPWLESRPSCVQGAIMHLSVWGASTSWVGQYENASDEEIVLKVRNVIANTGSTVGAASGDENSGRAYNEPQIALEILAGRATTEEVEEWVRKAQSSVFDFKFR